MTQEQKDQLIADLCARFPYGIYAKLNDTDMRVIDLYYYRGDVVFNLVSGEKTYIGVEGERVRPYLRSMSTMTVEESKEYQSTFATHVSSNGLKMVYPASESYDWLNRKHFDFRGLIELGLAFEAPDWMYVDE